MGSFNRKENHKAIDNMMNLEKKWRTQMMKKIHMDKMDGRIDEKN